MNREAWNGGHRQNRRPGGVAGDEPGSLERQPPDQAFSSEDLPTGCVFLAEQPWMRKHLQWMDGEKQNAADGKTGRCGYEENG